MKRRDLLEKYYNQVENQYYERSTYTFYDVYSVSIGSNDDGSCCNCILCCLCLSAISGGGLLSC